MSREVVAFFCERKHFCRWQGYRLHQGLGWGTIPIQVNPWREAHDRECGGKLVPLFAEEITRPDE